MMPGETELLMAVGRVVAGVGVFVGPRCPGGPGVPPRGPLATLVVAYRS